jgi:aspartyl/asparaginyl beta-hydroxylase (cupin superfamily)
MNQYELFPFLTQLEENWKDVLEELDSLLYAEAEANVSLFQAWHEREIYEGDWDVYGLYEFGKKNLKNCERCPKTTALVESIPGMTTAGFSGLAPGTHIKPHVGYTGEVLRCHLGLIVPNPLPDYDRRATGCLTAQTCGLRVGDDLHYWAPGEAFVFDDTIEHEAYNWGNRTRFVLLIDFKKEVPQPESDGMKRLDKPAKGLLDGLGSTTGDSFQLPFLSGKRIRDKLKKSFQ